MSEYINKEELHAELVKHLANVKAATEQGLPIPPANNIIGSSIIMIAQNLAHRPNFRSYTWIDEMISDGIEAATRAINKYDPERSNNPFGFFTQCIYWAFQGRIKIENTNTKKRIDMMKDALSTFYDDGPDGVHHDIDKNAIISLIEEN